MGRSRGSDQEQQSSAGEPGRRSARVRTAVAEAVLGCIEADAALTYEEILDALLGEASAITGRLRRGQATPPTADEDDEDDEDDGKLDATCGCCAAGTFAGANRNAPCEECHHSAETHRPEWYR